MTPEHLDWVELSSHAQTRMEEHEVRSRWLIGRIKAGHGFFFKDTERGSGRYDVYFPDRDLAATIQVEWDANWNSKTAHVLTVFEVSNHVGRYHLSDRFENHEVAANKASSSNKK